MRNPPQLRSSREGCIRFRRPRRADNFYHGAFHRIFDLYRLPCPHLFAPHIRLRHSPASIPLRRPPRLPRPSRGPTQKRTREACHGMRPCDA